MAIPCGSVTLEGDLVIPPKARGLVLFAHGSGSSRHSPRNQFVAGVVNQARLGTLLFDLLTEEEEIVDRATLQYRFNIPFLARRMAEVTRWIAPRRPQCRIGYFGSSTGGGAALIAAAELKKLIGAIVCRGGRPDLAGETLRRVTAPTLLVVGGNDRITLKLNETALLGLRCPKALRIVPGATHLFEEPGALEAVARLAAEWFQQHLCASSPAVSPESDNPG